MRDITPLVAPEAVAVIGASTNPSKSGGVLFSNLVQGGFAGSLYPINPRADSVMGRQAYPKIADVPGPVDLAFIVLPRQHVEDALVQCVESRVRAACIITAGFSESGPEGRAQEERLARLAQQGDVLLAGPNTIGIVNADRRMMGSFVNFPYWQGGNISIFAQTGIFTGALMLQVMSASTQRPGIGKSIDVGNKVDVDEVDFLAFAKDDPGTGVVGLYLESIRHPRPFLELAAEVRARKPVVVLKPGRTSQGAKASESHTGSLATDDAVFDAALRQFGVIRAEDEAEFLDFLKAFSLLPVPRGPRTAILTTSGALGVLATDQAVASGLDLSDFMPETLERLRSILPEWQPAGNPFDFWVGLETRGNRLGHEITLNAVMADSNVDMVLCALLAPPNADFPEIGEIVAAVRQKHPEKPLALVICGGSVRDRWVAELEGARVPVYASTTAAMRALRALARYASHG
jgi:acetyltransferase